ncbi:MAG TPA: class I SAM-dependent methyltransferase [Acidimicrobiales bacterium]|nr:class I SAM-dependent methyltransferase [Acidimicrobiales bacterium]
MYDPVAREYAEQFRDELAGKPFDRALLDSVAARCRGGVIADLGCGPGQVGRYVGAGVGLDRSFEMLRLVPFPAVHGDLRALPFADGSLAGIVAFYCYIHIEELGVAFADARRALRPGGVFVLSVHEGDEGWLHRDEWYDKPIDIWVRLWSKAEIDDAVVAAGFTIESSVIRESYEGELFPRLYVTAVA